MRHTDRGRQTLKFKSPFLDAAHRSDFLFAFKVPLAENRANLGTANAKQQPTISKSLRFKKH